MSCRESGSLGTAEYTRELKGSDPTKIQQFGNYLRKGEFTQAINVLTNPPGHTASSCLQIPIMQLPASSDIDTQALRSIVQDSFQQYSDCRNLVTGNMYKGEPDIEKVSPEYAMTFALSFAKEICSPEDSDRFTVLSSPSMGASDVLSVDAFNKTASKTAGAKNIAATYAVLYTLGYRESSGNFLEGRDLSANNTKPETEESGLFQLSANILIGNSNKARLARNTMVSVVNGLSDLQDQAEMSSFCYADQLRGKKMKKKIFAGDGQELKILMESECREIKHKMVKNQYFDMSSNRLSRMYPNTKKISRCFSKLQKLCPRFAIETAASQIRLNRKHNGPLWTKGEWGKLAQAQYRRGNRKKADFYQSFASQQRPYLQPGCQGMFQDIIDRKDLVCMANQNIFDLD